MPLVPSNSIRPLPGENGSMFRAARPLAGARAFVAVFALVLLLTAGAAVADLRATLSPFVGTDEPTAAPPVVGPVNASDAQPIALYSPRLLAEFYAERDYRAAWDDRRARTMLELARRARADGFLPADFHADAIAALLDRGGLDAADAGARTSAELLLSDALLRYVHHFRFGKHNPRHVNPGGTFVEPADAERLKADMAQALATPGMAEELAAMLPSPDFYRNLKKGYQRYLAIADRGGWVDIPGGPNLRVGAKDARVPLIREHLAVIDGYEPGFVAAPETYDHHLAEAVKGFQRRSGLAADGIVGPNTLRALNVPLDERLLTIRANLERMRWLYNDLPADYLFVDIAAFDLYLVREHEEVWRTRGIIGTVEDQTPMFRDEMEYLVFNPTWTVPKSIEKKFKGVPAGYKRVRSGGQYYLVQEPGPRNALGRVKFMFPNGHAIYLHDTPSRYLFNRSRRAYSHGCIRVHRPLTLAEQVLNEPAWSEAAINSVVRRGKTRWVHLDEHLPVLLYYLTAKADAEGRVGFRRDIYNRDHRLLAMLDEPADHVEGAERIAFAEPELQPDPEATPDGEPSTEGDGEATAATEAADADDGGSMAAQAETTGAADAAASTATDVDSAAAQAGSPAQAQAAAAAQTASPATDAIATGTPLAEAAEPEAGPQPLEAPSGEAVTAGDSPPDSGAGSDAQPPDQPPSEPDNAPATAAEPKPATAGDDDTQAKRLESPGVMESRSGPVDMVTDSASGSSRSTVLQLDAAGRFRGMAQDQWSLTEGSLSSTTPRLEPVRLDLRVRPPAIGVPPAATDSHHARPRPVRLPVLPTARPPRIAEEPPVRMLPAE